MNFEVRLAAACHKVLPTLQSERTKYVQPYVTQPGAVAGDLNQGTYSIQTIPTIL